MKLYLDPITYKYYGSLPKPQAVSTDHYPQYINVIHRYAPTVAGQGHQTVKTYLV